MDNEKKTTGISRQLSETNGKELGNQFLSVFFVLFAVSASFLFSNFAFQKSFTISHSIFAAKKIAAGQELNRALSDCNFHLLELSF